MPAKMSAGSRTQLVKHKLTGKLVSAKSKTGNPMCSQAMSQWKSGGMTPAVAAILGKCRAMAYQAKRGAGARAAGNEGKAQHWEHNARRGLSMAERANLAKELRAERADQMSGRNQRLRSTRRFEQTGGVSKGGAVQTPEGRAILADRLRSERAQRRAGIATTPAEPWYHTGSIDSPGTGAEIHGEGGPQRQNPIPQARFTAARKSKAQEIRAQRAAARTQQEPGAASGPKRLSEPARMTLTRARYLRDYDAAAGRRPEFKEAQALLNRVKDRVEAREARRQPPPAPTSGPPTPMPGSKRAVRLMYQEEAARERGIPLADLRKEHAATKRQQRAAARPAAPTPKPASEIDPEGRQYARRKMEGPTLLLQSMRRARYMATIDAGKGVGTADRAALADYRQRYGVTPERVRGMRQRMAALRAEAESKGYAGGGVVAQGRRDAREELREDYASRMPTGPMLTRGVGYYPGPGDRLRARAASRAEPYVSPVPKNVFLTPRPARLGYNRTDLPEAARTTSMAEARKTAAQRIRAERAARAKAAPIGKAESGPATAAPIGVAQAPATAQPIGRATPTIAAEIRKGTRGLIHSFARADKGRGKKRMDAKVQNLENLRRSAVAANQPAKAARYAEHLAKVRTIAAGGSAYRKPAPAPAPTPRPAGPSLREQAAAHRASKGAPRQRALAMIERAEKHTAARLASIRGDAKFNKDRREDVAMDALHARMRRISPIANPPKSKVDAAIERRAARQALVEARQDEARRVVNAEMARPVPKNVDNIEKQIKNAAKRLGRR